MRKRIFISYRRSDTQMAAGRLHDALVARFGAATVFRDKETIRPGHDWVEEIRSALQGDVVVLALLGPHWASSQDAQGRRRLEDPLDSNRVELETALAKSVPLIPVLVDDATVPDASVLPGSLEPLTRRNAVRLRDDDWDADFARLADALISLGVRPVRQTTLPPGERRLLARPAVWLGGLGMAGVIVAGLFGDFRTSPPREQVPPGPPAAGPPILNLTGTWRDLNYAGVVDQVTQDGPRLQFRRVGVLPNGVGFETSGEGTLEGTRMISRYSARYQNGQTSTGSCTGTVSPDGSRIESRCVDTLLGTISGVGVRQ